MNDATVCLTFDFDAVSPWLHIDPERNTPTNRSRGLFGAEVGAPRLLDLLAEYGLATTWFVPGHTLDSFPEVAGRVADEGHEIQHHGWSHTPPGDYEDRAAERADIERGIDSIERVTGRRPRGYRSPSWDFSEHTKELIAELGFEWDSSDMAREFKPYWVRPDTAPADGPYEQGETFDLVELPVSWGRDDYPPFAHSPGKGAVDERAVYRQWREQLDWMADYVNDGVFVLTMHPQVSGKSHRVQRLEDFIEHVRGHGRMSFATCSEVAAAVRST